MIYKSKSISTFACTASDPLEMRRQRLHTAGSRRRSECPVLGLRLGRPALYSNKDGGDRSRRTQSFDYCRIFSHSRGCSLLRFCSDYTVWVKKKSPPTVFWNIFPNGSEFLINFLHTYYTIIYTLEYKFLFKYLQLWQSYAILKVTT